MDVAELLALKYPFGREQEASIHLLFRSFCNNLFIGQFEWARASIKELHDRRAFLKYHVKDAFYKALERWRESDGRLHTLTWPCFTEYKYLTDKTGQIEELTKALEFHFVVDAVCKDCDADMLEEINMLQKQGADHISIKCRDILTSLMLQVPSLATLLTALVHECVAFQMSNILLDAMHQSVLQKNSDCLYQLMARGKLDMAMDGVSDRLGIILQSAFSDHGSTVGESWLNCAELMVAAASCTDLSLYKLTQTAHLHSHVSCFREGSQWRARSLEAFNHQTHFFDAILSEAYKLMKEHRYTELVSLFELAEWQPLLPFIFHRAWRLCANTEQSHHIITAFLKVKDAKLTALINQHQRIDVIEQSLNLSSTKSRTPFLGSSGVLSVPKSRSVLHALFLCLDDLNSWTHQKMIKTLMAESAYALLDQFEDEISDHSLLSVKQQRDVNLFNAFYIIDNVMQACCEASREGNNNALSQRYAKDVVPLLDIVKKFLANLKPLTLKLEVIEDIFLLLFTTGTDLLSTGAPLSSNSTPPLYEGKATSAEPSGEDEQYFSARDWLTPTEPLKSNQNHDKGEAFRPIRGEQASRTERSSDDNVGSESLSNTAVGFMANEFIARDLLNIVKTALTDVTAAHFESMNDSACKRVEEELRQVTLSSITEHTFMSRLSQLQQNVSEAFWRYQLILRDSVDKEFGSTVLRSTAFTSVHNDDGYGAYERELYKNKAQKPSPHIQRSEDVSQESELSSEMLTYSSGTNTQTVPSKNKRYKKRLTSQNPTLAPPTLGGLIPKMLASPESLLNICINRQSFVQAGQVIKLYNMEDSGDAKLFQFGQSYKHYVLEQFKHDTALRGSDGQSGDMIDLSMIRLAASSSLNTIDDSVNAERLALSAVLPAVKINDSQVGKFLGATTTPSSIAAAMVLLDLACISTDAQRSQHLLTLAHNHISASKSKCIPGLLTWLRKCHAVNLLALSSQYKSYMCLPSIVKYDHVYLRSCLLSPIFGMEVSALNVQAVPFVELCKDVQELEKEMKSGETSDILKRSRPLYAVKALLRSIQQHFSACDRQYLSILKEQIGCLEQTITDNHLQPSGPAAVLYDGPTMTMGRLMFENNIKPSTLVSVAAKLKLDLTHVIVRSCCPPIQCKPLEEDTHTVAGMQRELTSGSRFGYRRVLNAVSDDVTANLDSSPQTTVSTAFNTLLKLVNDKLAAENSKVLNRLVAIKIKEMPGYAQFSAECKNIQRVDLKLLKSDREKRSFFINLHNLLSLHGLVEFLTTRRKSHHMVDSISSLTAFQLRTSYIIGQLGLCSIFELQQLFLKVNVLKQLDMASDHPWACFAPEHNPLVIFSLYDGTTNILPLRCVNVDTVDEEILDSVTMYMRQAVLISPHSYEISIPEMLVKVRKELVIEVDSVAHKYGHAALLLWILEYQPATRWSEMKLIMDRLEHQNDGMSSAPLPEASVSIIPMKHQIGFFLDPSTASMLEPTNAIDLDIGVVGNGPAYSLTRSDSILQHAQFDISGQAVKYLHEQSPVVAMLLDIIYEDMHLNNVDGRHFDCEALLRDYPHLHKYLIQYIFPLCANLYEHMKDLYQLAEIELPYHIKSAILTHMSYRRMEHSATRCIDALMRDDRHAEVIDVIGKLIALTADNSSDWLAIQDFVLMQSASEQVSSEAINSIKCLSCERLQAHISISGLHRSRLTAEKSMQIFALCEKGLVSRGDKSLVPYVKELRKRMSAYHRIALHAQAKHDMVIEGCTSKVLHMLASGWHCVGHLLSEHPIEVAHLLFDSQEFRFTKKLIDKMDDVNNELKMLVYKRYIVHSLDTDEISEDEIQDLLGKYLTEDLHSCFSLCMQVLEVLRKPTSMLILVKFMMHNMSMSLGDKQKDRVQLCYIGVQMLLELDESCHSQYRELIFQPLLIFEQLLMNAKIFLAGKVLPLLSTCHRVYTEEINQLLMDYAEKAISFPLLSMPTDVPIDALAEVPASVSEESRRSPSPGSTTATKLRNSPSKMSLQKALLSSPLRRSSTQQSLPGRLPRITTAPGKLSDMTESRTSVVPSHAGHSSGGETRRAHIMPERVPAREEWMSDDQAQKCMLCKVEKFSMFSRRHHCRRCGLVVCATCSSHTAPLGGRSVRVCEGCYDTMFKHRQTDTSSSAQADKSRNKQYATPASVIGSQQATLSQQDSLPEWLLTTSETDNHEIRSDFFYDHAPSVSLCTSILQLYSNGIECARYMLKLCEKLSQIVKPIQQMSINEEVDYNLVISMMKFLLLNAKLLFVKDHCIDGVGMCEAYKNRVEVLSLLISDYYINLPTVEELANIDNVRRLRDKLMADERPELAIEISTRFGLETTAIWSAWGFNCLRKADYIGARDKFSKFLKPLTDKNAQTVAHGIIINDILNILMTTAVHSKLAVESTLKALTSGHDVGKSIMILPMDGSKFDGNMDNVQECLYYLNTFSNHQMVIKFYTDHGFLPKAIQYCLDRKCSPQLFIKHVFQPSLVQGELSFLQEQLLSVDPSLQMCGTYLTAVCRLLAKLNQYHVLYKMQIFTKDYLRAAMTCIQAFYLSKASSYIDLTNRKNHLNRALEHYQSYLNPSRADRLSRQKHTDSSAHSSDSLMRLTQPDSEVRRLISLVKLQIDVTQHMGSSGSSVQPVLSLFGEQEERIALASQAILVSKSVSAGFELAFRIIQDCQLSYNKVYTVAAKQMGEQRAYSNVKALVNCIKESGLCDVNLLDRVLLSFIQPAAGDPSSSSQIEGLIKLLTTNGSKIEAYIICGKLRNAYLLAIQTESIETVSRIAEEAVRLNQPTVKTICAKYLKQRQSQ